MDELSMTTRKLTITINIPTGNLSDYALILSEVQNLIGSVEAREGEITVNDGSFSNILHSTVPLRATETIVVPLVEGIKVGEDLGPPTLGRDYPSPVST